MHACMPVHQWDNETTGTHEVGLSRGYTAVAHCVWSPRECLAPSTNLTSFSDSTGLPNKHFYCAQSSCPKRSRTWQANSSSNMSGTP